MKILLPLPRIPRITVTWNAHYHSDFIPFYSSNHSFCSNHDSPFTIPQIGYANSKYWMQFFFRDFALVSSHCLEFWSTRCTWLTSFRNPQITPIHSSVGNWFSQSFFKWYCLYFALIFKREFVWIEFLNVSSFLSALWVCYFVVFWLPLFHGRSQPLTVLMLCHKQW